MTGRRRFALAGLAVALFVTAGADTARGFARFGSTWATGGVPMHMQLPGSSSLTDGSAHFAAAVTAAMTIWNNTVNRVQFAPVQDSTIARGDGDSFNQVFFDSTYYGRPFGPNELAVTTRWTLDSTRRVEADIVFNTAIQWDSYRGSRRGSVWDIRRVALHELGHALGLDHPDANGQSVAALMNSLIGDLDSLQQDDIDGATSMYTGGVVGTISFPPRNEPADFYNQLLGVYQNELGAGRSTTYVDAEGAVIWLTEYARQRVGQCGHETATENTLNQLVGAGTLVCAATPGGPIPFPPRDQGLLFMNALDAAYRDMLRRPATSSFVDNEGAVVWVLEYLRYRLNRCNHGDATTKVFQQIRGQGIQPTC